MSNLNEKKEQHNWTSQEEELLVELYPTTTAREIAKILNIDSIQSIQKKATRLGLKKRSKGKAYINSNNFAKLIKVHPKTILKWVKDEGLPCRRVDKGYKDKTVYINVRNFWLWAEKHKDLLYFSKIEPNVLAPEPKWVKKARLADEKIVKKQNNTRPHWTKEEEEFLFNNYGEIPVYKIEKRLGRKNIERKLDKEKLGYCTEYQGLLTANRLAKVLNVDPHTVLNWVHNKGLPHKKKIMRYTREYIIIDVPDFWNWAEQNKQLVPFHKIKPDTLVPEPNWVEKERKNKYLSTPQRQRKVWSTEEDSQLRYLKYQLQLSNQEIAKRMHRTTTSIRRRLDKFTREKNEQVVSGLKDMTTTGSTRK
jgi:plasmid maintenance system antidote protein VapI